MTKDLIFILEIRNELLINAIDSDENQNRKFGVIKSFTSDGFRGRWVGRESDATTFHAQSQVGNKHNYVGNPRGIVRPGSKTTNDNLAIT